MGSARLVVAGGFESMSRVPYYLPQAARAPGLRLGHAALTDGVILDGLWDPYNDIHMGSIAEACAAALGITRAEQDAYAAASYRRAAAAAAARAREIVGVAGAGAGAAPVLADEEVARVDFAKMASLRPAFALPAGAGAGAGAGTVTAANASKLNDGGAALVLASAERARELGLTPLARVRACADAEQAPTDFPTAPAAAVRLALARAGAALRDCSAHEVNEAFAVVALANARLLGLDDASLNAHGGAIALGHPIGASGARIVGALLSVLQAAPQAQAGALGTASICNGGGGATAVVIERLR